MTGATGGIGQAIVRAFAARGADVDRQRPARRCARAAGLGGRRPRGRLRPRATVTRWQRLAEEAADVDVFVANAALPASGMLTELTQEQIDRMLEVNLRAPMALARALAPRMIERRRGHMVFISSLAGKAASPASSIYSATKFGLRGFALGTPGGPAAVRRRRLGRAARFHPRRRDVRGRPGRAAARSRNALARRRRRVGDPCDRAQPRRGRGRAGRPAGRVPASPASRRSSQRRSAAGSAARRSPRISPPGRPTSASSRRGCRTAVLRGPERPGPRFAARSPRRLRSSGRQTADAAMRGRRRRRAPPAS